MSVQRRPKRLEDFLLPRRVLLVDLFRRTAVTSNLSESSLQIKLCGAGGGGGADEI